MNFGEDTVTAGDYVEIRTADLGDTESYNLVKITEVGASTITLEEGCPSTFPIGTALTIVQGENVNDGNITIENLTLRGEVAEAGVYHIFDNLNNGWAINSVCNDVDMIYRGRRDLIERDNTNDWTFNRGEMSTTVPISNMSDKGFELPYGSVFNSMKWIGVNTSSGGEGFSWINCYFENVKGWNEGGYYERCYFEGTTPAQQVLNDLDTPWFSSGVLEPRFINVPNVERVIMAKSIPLLRTTVFAATEGSWTTYSGAWRIVSKYIHVADGNTVSPDPSVTAEYINGSSVFTYIGTTVATGTVYITIMAIG